MGINRFIVNRDVDLDGKVRKIVERVFPNITQPDIAKTELPLPGSGVEVNNYEGAGTNQAELIVWGTTRMGSKRVVAI